jgi:hypothetical protein
MSKTTNEMNLPIISVPMMGISGTTAGPAMEMPGQDQKVPASYADETMVIGSPHMSHDASCISICAESIQPCGGYDPECEVCTFDVIFNVCIREGDTSKTYRVIKRIGIDKIKLACDAECSAPISIVESKTEALKEQASATTQRFRRLAGLD